MSFPRYPAYKESGVDWLGDVPAHWTVLRMKHAVDSVKNGIWGDEARGNENDIACVRVADFDRVGLCVSLDEPTIRNVLPNERTGRVLQSGDLLLEKSGGGEQQPVGCVVLYDHHHPAVCSNFVARVTIRRDADASFWRYAHAAAYSLRVNTKSVKQTSGIQNLDSQAYFDELGPFPPLPEQRAIAAFLDRETAKIDALVAEQRRLVDLLREKRQAVISHAVTKGLNPDAPMKDSGVEWLGEVPAHWDLNPLKRYIAFITSGSRGWADHYADEGDVFLRIANLTRETIRLDLEDVQRVQVPEGAEGERTRVAPGDILFSITAYLGSVAVIPDSFEGGYVSQHVALVRISKALLEPTFGAYAALSVCGQTWFQRQSYGGTKIQLSLDDVRDLPIPVPPIEEQRSIVGFIEAELSRLEEMSAEAMRAVSILNERRAALINAAVTGQIDVRALESTEAA